ncbi:hypothetical protein D3C75_990530 [compost metagenome]
MHVLRVGLAEGVLRGHHDGTLVTALEAEQGVLETWQQVAIANLEGGRGLVERAVDGVAVFQVQREVQGDFGVLADTGVSHGPDPRTSCS